METSFVDFHHQRNKTQAATSEPHHCFSPPPPPQPFASPSSAAKKQGPALDTTDTNYTDGSTCTQPFDIGDELSKLMLDPRAEESSSIDQLTRTTFMCQDTLLYGQLYQSFDPEYIPKLKSVNRAVRFLLANAVAKAMSLILSFPPGCVSPTVHEYLKDSQSCLQLLGDCIGIKFPILDQMINNCQKPVLPALAKERVKESNERVKRLQETRRAVDRAVQAEQLAKNWLTCGTLPQSFCAPLLHDLTSNNPPLYRGYEQGSSPPYPC